MRLSALLLLLSLLLVLAGCGGGGPVKSVGNVVTVTVAPTPISMNAGAVLQLQVTALDANKKAVLNQTFTFKSSNPAIQVSNNGLLCAGKWDSLTTPVVCTPAAPGTAGIAANVTSTVQGVTSPAVPIFVHEQVASLSVAPISLPAAGCVSQNGKISYQAIAKDAAGNNITPSVGTFNWQLSTPNVGSLTSITVTNNSTNIVTAKLPGITNVSVNINSTNPVNSVPTTFVECPVASISISPPSGVAANPLVINGAGKTVQLSASVVDSQGVAVANQPLLWNSSLGAVAAISSKGLATGVAAGTTNLSASCTPGTCNLGFNQPVFSNLITANVPGTANANVFATGTGTKSLVPITNGTAGTAIALAQKPNSFVFDAAGTNGFLGSSSGLMIFSPSTKTVAAPIGNIPGTVLAVNPAGTEVLIANGGETLLYNVTPKTVNVLNISGAVSADFTPDGARAFVLSSNHCAGQASGGCLFTVQPGSAISSTPLPSTPPSAPVGVQRISILASGQVGYIAYGGVPFSSFETCNGQLSGQGSLLIPDLAQTLPDGSMIMGAEPAYTDEIGVVLSGSGCAPTPTNTETQQLFGSNFNARQIIVTPNSHDAYVTSDAAGQVFHYNVGLGTATPISLSNGAATTFTGGATPDSANVYIGASDNAVHRINVANSTDAQQIPLGFTPDLVAVQP